MAGDKSVAGAAVGPGGSAAETSALAAKNRTSKFQFSVSDRGFKPSTDTTISELLAKWTMRDSMRVTRFRFDQSFQRYELKDFVTDFFRDPTVVSALQVLCDVRGHWTSLGEANKCTSVATKHVGCTATSMEFFDRLYSCEAVRSNGSLPGCFPEYLENFTINQEVGKVLLQEDSEHYGIFNSEERSELLFRIFQHLTLGGPLNQYEDYIGPYFDTVKAFYKDLVSVGKDPKTGKVFCTSCAVEVITAEGLFDLFPQPEHPQNFCYLIVNPIKREVTVWYHAWCGDL